MVSQPASRAALAESWRETAAEHRGGLTAIEVGKPVQGHARAFATPCGRSVPDVAHGRRRDGWNTGAQTVDARQPEKPAR